MRLRGNFTIVVDTRERTPWRFDNKVIRRKLSTGDYTVLGYTKELRVERKSFPDYLCCIGSKWKHFVKQLNALARIEYSAVIVEGSAEQVTWKQYRHLMSQDAFLSRTAEVAAVWGMPILLAGSRWGGQHTCLEFLKKVIEA